MIRWMLAAALATVGVHGATARGDNGATTRPAAELLAFHVSDADFKPIEPAPWVYEKVLQAFIPIEKIDEAAEWGVDVVHGSGPDMYYPLMKDGGEGPPAETTEMVKAYVAKARSRGMKVLVGVNPGAPVNMVKAHPEWMVCPTPDIADRHAKAELDLSKDENWHYRQLSLNTPYGDYMIENMAEIMTTFDVDGFSFDGNYHPPINYSPFDRELYEKETGHPFPAAIDLADVNYRLYLIWADDRLENWYRRLHERLRQIKPDATVCTWTTNAGRYGHFLTNPRVMSTRMNRLLDAPIQEWWLDEVNHGSTLVPAFGAAYVRTVAGGRTGASEPYMMSRGNPYCGDNFPGHELFVRCMLAMTNGSMTPINLGAGEPAMRTAKEIHRRAQWFIRTEQMPWAAMLVSEQSRQFYGYRDPMANFLNHCVGVFRSAYESHLPLNLINDWDINEETLAKYKVLILPNATCLSDAQVEAIRTFVANGGGLVATCETSLFDELGRPRADFALKDLFGVSYEGRINTGKKRTEMDVNFAIVVNDEYWAKRQGYAALRPTPATDDAHALLKDSFVYDPAGLTFKGPLVQISAPAAPMSQLMMMFPDAGADTYPAGVIGNYGKGRVVYYPIGLDAANFSYGFRYTRALLRRSIEWAANDAFPISVEAPMCVQSTFFSQEDEKGSRVVVHLFNDLNTNSNHGLSEVDVPLREEVVPIHGIKLRFRGERIERYHFEPEGVDLKATREGDVDVIELPPLEVHSMVIAEREKGAKE